MTVTTSTKEINRPKKLSNDEKLLIWSFTLFANESIVREIFSRVFGLLGLPSSQTAAILFVYFPVLLVIINRIHLRRRLGIAPFIFVFSILALLFAVSLLLHPEYEAVMFDGTWPYNIERRVFGPFSAIWVVLFIGMIRRLEPILVAIKAIAYVSFISGLVSFSEAMQRGYWSGTSLEGVRIEQDYSLEFGYAMLVPVLVFIILVFRGERRLLNTALAVGGFTMIIIGGNRAPAVFILVAVVVLGFLFSGSSLRTSPTGVFRMASFTAVITIVILNFERILRVSGRLLESAGISSRSLQTALEGSFTDDNGRTELHELSSDLIANGEFWGYGMYGDRYHIVDHYWWGYPHNIVLEMQITFGSVMGIFILIVIATFLLISFFKAPSFEYRLLMVFFALLCLQLFVSLSYLYNPWFWALLVIAYISLNQSNLNKSQKIY